MARKKSRLGKIKRFLNVLLLLPMFLGTLLLPPTFAHITSENSSVQHLPDTQNLVEQGRKFYEIEQYAQAAKIWEQAISAFKGNGNELRQAIALGNLSLAYQQLGQWSEAEGAIAQSLNLLKTTQNINAKERSQILAQALDINAQDIGYRWQWQLGRLLKAKGDTEGAIAAYNEAVDSLQSIRDDLVAVNPEVKFSFRDEVEPVYRELVELLLQPGENSQPNQANIEKASKTIELLQVAELDNFFRNTCLNAQIKSKKQDQTAITVIYPFILPDRLEVILRLPQKHWLHYATAVSKDEVQTTLKQLQENLTKPHTLRKIQSLSQKVYNWLIKPAEAVLAESQTPTLVFVLDGWLRNIPMAALYDGKQYLIEKYSIALTPGLQLIEPKPLQKELKVIAAGLSEPSSGFSALPNVKRELEQIRADIPSNILLNQEFTRSALQNRINSLPFPVVHLATHGQFSSKAEETFIVAWKDRIYVKQFNQLVRTIEQNRPEAIELLVLSACQTAAGDERAGLGIAGVAFQAGARSTIASLWNLDDESTSVLMNKFYQELANKKLTKAEALRRAQLALLQNPKYKRPRFWASYVLLGNWL